MNQQSDGAAVAALARARLGDIENWADVSNYGYPSLALCLIDTVFSLRARYAAAKGAVDRYLEYRELDGARNCTDGVSDLLEAIESINDGAELFGNRQVAPGTTLPKHEVIGTAARKLRAAGIESRSDLQLRLDDENQSDHVRRSWLSVSGLGPASWHYLVMLSGRQDSKPDVWIKRFVRDALNNPNERITSDRVRTATLEAARLLGISAVALDHNIWRAKGEVLAPPSDSPESVS